MGFTPSHSIKVWWGELQIHFNAVNATDDNLPSVEFHFLFLTPNLNWVCALIAFWRWSVNLLQKVMNKFRFIVIFCYRWNLSTIMWVEVWFPKGLTRMMRCLHQSALKADGIQLSLPEMWTRRCLDSRHQKKYIPLLPRQKTVVTSHARTAV